MKIYKTTLAYYGSVTEMAEDIVSLSYESLQQYCEGLAAQLAADADADNDRGYEQLSDLLDQAAEEVGVLVHSFEYAQTRQDGLNREIVFPANTALDTYTDMRAAGEMTAKLRYDSHVALFEHFYTIFSERAALYKKRGNMGMQSCMYALNLGVMKLIKIFRDIWEICKPHVLDQLAVA